MRLFSASDYATAELLVFHNAALEKIFPCPTTIDNRHYKKLMPYFKGVNKARNHPY